MVVNNSYLDYYLWSTKCFVRNKYLGDYIHIRAVSYCARNAIPRVCPPHFDQLYVNVWRFALVGRLDAWVCSCEFGNKSPPLSSAAIPQGRQSPLYYALMSNFFFGMSCFCFTLQAFRRVGGAYF